ncbi:hypothetical protein NDS46_07565 [Paenibacillus thiaminolyticus]|uniref:hypothetical protein n=1 Tax=Paenibacillus thiaminolyticus TaxID=49283 RepID=UPI00232DE4B1|nr:hypothetical protein [Paenibacillus thiaminolyticus]WCF09720.1 hypothetical protein NDS46_07565 [Paenibacillus thiaminolyticus]
MTQKMEGVCGNVSEVRRGNEGGMFYPYVRRAAGLKVTEENVEIIANRSNQTAFQTQRTSFTIE